MAKKKPTDSLSAIALSIDWADTSEFKSIYANNMRVQRAEHEFYLYFYEITPPVISGTKAEVLKAIAKNPSVHATCVGKIVVPIAKIADFAKALATMASENIAVDESPGKAE